MTVSSNQTSAPPQVRIELTKLIRYNDISTIRIEAKLHSDHCYYIGALARAPQALGDIMYKSVFPVFLLLLLALPQAAPVLAADIPELPYVEVSVATEGPLSLLSTPDGSGHPLTQAFDSTGQPADGTITMTLFDDSNIPVAYFPAEDIWLEDMTGSLIMCFAGTIPDGDTDANGTTTWTRALYAGGHVEPTGGNQLAIRVMGDYIEGGDLPDFRLNSADINGDLVVNLTDVALFTMGYYGPYAYPSDLHWDGAVNLSDLAELARAVGAVCP